MLTQLSLGRRIPAMTFSHLVDGEVKTVRSEKLFAGRRAVVIGVPGAFTPVCTEKHLPDFVSNADRLRASGIELVVCITPNDPWVNAAWSQMIDPDRKIMMLSDGNLDFARELGLTAHCRELFLGERSQRYLMQLRNSVIERLNVERSILTVACTLSNDVMIAA